MYVGAPQLKNWVPEYIYYYYCRGLRDDSTVVIYNILFYILSLKFSLSC